MTKPPLDQTQPLEQIALDMMYLSLNMLDMAGKGHTEAAQLLRDAIGKADTELDAINDHIIRELIDEGYSPYLGPGG